MDLKMYNQNILLMIDLATKYCNATVIKEKKKIQW